MRLLGVQDGIASPLLYKYLAAVNGGAAIALLAYLGNIAAKVDCTTQKPSVPDMRCPMGAFLVGVLACVAMTLAYYTQLALFNTTQGRPKRHLPALIGAATSVLISLTAFGVGCTWAVVAFR